MKLILIKLKLSENLLKVKKNKKDFNFCKSVLQSQVISHQMLQKP